MDVYRRLKAFYWPYRHQGLLSLLCVVLMIAAGLIRPVLLQQLVDRVLVAGRYHELPWLALSVVAVAFVRGLFHYGRAYLGHVFGANAVYDLRNALYQQLQSLSFSYYDTAKTGELMSRLAGDVEVFRQFLAFGLANLLDFVLLVTFGLVTMLALDWQLTLVSLVTLPFLAVLARRFHHVIHPTFLRLREAMAEMSAAAQESITGVRTVKSFAREPQQIDYFSQKVSEYVRRHLGAAEQWARFFPWMEAMGNLSVLLLLAVGGRRVMSGAMSLGELVAFFSLIWYLIAPLQQLGYHINQLDQSIAAGERLLEILETRSEITDRPGARPLGRIEGHVRFEHVYFTYDGVNPSLEDINLDAPPGSVIGLLGPTGSGKTTLVSLIPRFYDVTRGRVLVDGHDVRDVQLATLRRQVAIVFQETFLFSTTIRENISFARRDATFDEIVAAAKLAQAHDFIMELPQGYDTVVGERGLGLSGGQKQRIAIARALLADPRILILDDATASVDMETELAIQQALQELMKGRTTFIIAHRISSVMHADEILVLDRGRIVERGTHEELLRLGGIYRRIYDIQFRDYEEPLARRTAP